jgi:hypothetical protein
MQTRPALALGAAAVAVAAIAALATNGGAKEASAQTTFSELARSATAEVSSNWSGYVATAPSTTYTSVTGTWTQPAADCGKSGAGSASAFWVGLGGSSSTSQALEQIGTSADCSSSGTPSYYAWYELVPAASVKIALKVQPKDLITTSVNILNGTTVQLQIKNRTRHTSFTKLLTPASLDLTSAEWIAESPSLCNQFRCSTLPLADFGSISFSRLAAIGNGIGGTLTNPSWTTTAINLVADGGRRFFPGPDSYVGSAGSTGGGATAASVSSDGRGFTVSWATTSTAP